MAGFLDKFRSNVITSVWKDEDDRPEVKDIDDKIALGRCYGLLQRRMRSFWRKKMRRSRKSSLYTAKYRKMRW